MERESFLFYTSFRTAAQNVSRKQRKDIYEAIIEYALTGEEIPDMSPTTRMAFDLIKPQIDKNNQRFINSLKGGAPKGSSNNPNGRPKLNQELTEIKPKDKVKVNVKEKECEARVRAREDSPTPAGSICKKFDDWVGELLNTGEWIRAMARNNEMDPVMVTDFVKKFGSILDEKGRRADLLTKRDLMDFISNTLRSRSHAKPAAKPKKAATGKNNPYTGYEIKEY